MSDEEESRDVRTLIVSLRRTGATDEEITRSLNGPLGEFYPPPAGATAWTPYMISATLSGFGGSA